MQLYTLLKSNEAHTYQPINSYGVIGDCHSALLIAPDGSVDWGCLPDFDSPAIFCRLLDEQQGGYFQVAPADSAIPGIQRYLHNSNVLQTTFTCAEGELKLTDFMPVETLNACSYRRLDNNTWHQDDGSCHCLVRKLECVAGTLPVIMTLKVSPDYAASPAEICLIAQEGKVVISGGDQYIGLVILGAASASRFSIGTARERTGQRVVVRATLHEGEHLLFVLGVGRNLQAACRLVETELPQRDFEAELAHTLSHWRIWISQCNYRGPYASLVRRSALTLKMLTYAPTGAVVAAPTTSLPEEVGGSRNWDYRFTWLRDAALTLRALTVLGLSDETQAFIHWLLRLSYANGEDLQIMYGIRGERDLPERELTHLSGYRDSRPVRTGNAAASQKQLDVFGEVLDCIFMHWHSENFERYGETAPGPLWALTRMLVEHVCDHWHETDRGIWEVRRPSSHFVYSKVMCWVALDRGIRLAETFSLEADLARWRVVREQIREDILLHGYNPEIQSFTQVYNEASLDASNLLLPLVGFIAPDHSDMQATVERIMERLTDEQGFVYRYHSDDGLNGQEGTFTACTFWLVDTLAMQGRLEEAQALFERALACAGPLGLFSEEVAPGENLALGNYPQALTHIALINSAVNLEQASLKFKEQIPEDLAG